MFKINRYSSLDESMWDNFVPNSNNGTIFHLRSFLNYHPKNRFTDHSLIITKKDKLFSVLPAAEKRINGRLSLISHPGTTVGSFVVPENLSIAESMDLVKSLIGYAKKNSLYSIRITLPPNLYQRRLSNYMDFSFFKNGFQYLKRDVTSILFLEESHEDTVNKFRSSHRRAVKKAIDSGIEIKQSNDLASFYNILEKNLKIRHGVNPTHTLEELQHLHSLFPDRCNLFSAILNDKMIAGVFNFIVNEHVVLAFYISHDEKFAEYRAVNLLFYKIFDWAIDKKYKIYDFGTFTVNEEPNMGLGRFKENFGASGIFRDTIELVI